MSRTISLAPRRTARRVAWRTVAVAAAAVVAWSGLLGALVIAQDPPDDTRQIMAEEFIAARRAKTAKPAAKSGVAELGVTIWRLRPAAAGEDASRLLVQEDEGSTGWMPERVDAGQKLALGDRVRLSFRDAALGVSLRARPRRVRGAPTATRI